MRSDEDATSQCDPGPQINRKVSHRGGGNGYARVPEGVGNGDESVGVSHGYTRTRHGPKDAVPFAQRLPMGGNRLQGRFQPSITRDAHGRAARTPGDGYISHGSGSRLRKGAKTFLSIHFSNASSGLMRPARRCSIMAWSSGTLPFFLPTSIIPGIW